MSEPSVIGVVGGGSWGTALAALLVGRGHRVRLWVLEEEVVRQITEEGVNHTYLPDIPLPPALEATNDLADCLADVEVAVSVVPSQFVGSVWEEAAPHLPPGALLVSASKGIETSTLRRMDQVLADVLSSSAMRGFTALSGPSFAVEVAREVPTAVTVASESEEARLRVQEVFQTDFFRVYTVPDVVGVELGGALKNVVAIAAGVAAGLGLGHNTMAALITRGLAEMSRLGVALGARPTTFAGLAGMGDLVLTCTGDLSRNRTVGYRLGSGESLEEILGKMHAVAEGVKTTRAVRELSERHGVEMPIVEQVHRILVDGKAPRDALRDLMLREPKPEEWG